MVCRTSRERFGTQLEVQRGFLIWLTTSRRITRSIPPHAKSRLSPFLTPCSTRGYCRWKMRRLVKFWSLPKGERRLLREAGILLLLSNACIKVVAFKHIDRFLRAGWNDHFES